MVSIPAVVPHPEADDETHQSYKTSRDTYNFTLYYAMVLAVVEGPDLNLKHVPRGELPLLCVVL